MPILIRLLQKGDIRDEFHSGQPELDHFFHRYAGQNQFRYHIGNTYIATDEAVILGYATVAAGSLEAEDLPASSKFPANYSLPILRLGRLAVDARQQNRGVGKLLMRYIFELAIQQKNLVGCVGIVVDAKPQAISYYAQFGFATIGTNEQVHEGMLDVHPSLTPMFLSVKSILP